MKPRPFFSGIMHHGLNFVERLPPELSDNVCSYLPRISDIVNIRLVSRFWNNVATPRLLPTVHLILYVVVSPICYCVHIRILGASVDQSV